MDYLSRRELPRFGSDRTTDSRQQQSAGRMDVSKKSKTGVYILILVLVTFLTISLIVLAVLSALLFYQEDTIVTDSTTSNLKLNPTHHCQENTSDAQSCAKGWLFSNSSCYWLNPEALNWNDAEAACRRQNSTLVEISTQNELHVIANLITGDFWIGVRHQEGREDWVYSCSNISSPFTDIFSDGRPESNLCLGMISKTGLKSFYINHCDSLQPSLCEGNYQS